MRSEGRTKSATLVVQYPVSDNSQKRRSRFTKNQRVTPLLASAQRIGSWYKSSSRTKKGSELKARKKSISYKVIPKDKKKRQGFRGRARSEGLPKSLG